MSGSRVKKETILSRVWKNIKWLCNHPPTGLTTQVLSDTQCFNCGSYGPLFYFPGAGFAICHNCMKLGWQGGIRSAQQNKTNKAE